MPLGDGRGPAGLGPKTGRGLGYCGGFSHPGYMNRPGLGRNRGMVWYRGWTGNWEQVEKEILAQDLRVLKEEIKAIEERIKILESKPPANSAKKSKK